MLTSLDSVLYRDSLEPFLRLSDLDERVLWLVVEDDWGVARFGGREHFDAVPAGRFRVGIHARDKVGVEPDLRWREVSCIEREIFAVPDPDDLMPRRVPRPHLDPDAWQHVCVRV